MAWVRFHETAHRRTPKRVYGLPSMPPERRKAFAAHVKTLEPFAGGLAPIAVEREAQVGKEEGGSNFTTIANQLAFLNYPELAANTGASSFDPLMLAEGDTDLFVVAPEETIEHVKGWLRLWVAIPQRGRRDRAAEARPAHRHRRDAPPRLAGRWTLPESPSGDIPGTRNGGTATRGGGAGWKMSTICGSPRSWRRAWP